MTKHPYPLDKMIEGLSNEEYHAVDGLSGTQSDLNIKFQYVVMPIIVFKKGK